MLTELLTILFWATITVIFVFPSLALLTQRKRIVALEARCERAEGEAYKAHLALTTYEDGEKAEIFADHAEEV